MASLHQPNHIDLPIHSEKVVHLKKKLKFCIGRRKILRYCHFHSQFFIYMPRFFCWKLQCYPHLTWYADFRETILLFIHLVQICNWKQNSVNARSYFIHYRFLLILLGQKQDVFILENGDDNLLLREARQDPKKAQEQRAVGKETVNAQDKPFWSDVFECDSLFVW